MRKNGFTLIELLAVIVILAIIALIATPIILGIINDAREKANERSVELYASAVKNGIAAYQLLEGKGVAAGTYTKDTLPFEVEYDGKVDCTSITLSEDSKVSLSGCKVNDGEKEYSYGIEEENNSSKVCTLDDKDGDDVPSLNDIVTCGTENFYVMYNKNNEITMLSMFNLYVANRVAVGSQEAIVLENPTGIQNEIAKGSRVDDSADYIYGVIDFSPNKYWISENEELIPKYGNDYPANVYDENSNLYQYVSEYERILKEDFKVNTARATLVGLEEMEEFCIFDDGDYDCSTAPSWLYSTRYWTSVAMFDSGILMAFREDGLFMVNPFVNYWDNGIRPVITISVNEIK